MTYKHNFVTTNKYKEFMKSQLAEKSHKLVNGVVVSKEFTDRERDKDFYSKTWDRHPNRDKYQPYMEESIEMIKEKDCVPKNVLEVGAGCGNMLQKFITEFEPESYTAYEFSNSVKKINKKLKGIKVRTKISVVNDTFKDIEDIERYDCIIAHEIFEHIKWDIEFIEKIKAGTNLFFSVPTKHAKDHVRSFLTHESIYERYSSLVHIQEIRAICLHPEIYKWWCVSSVKK